MPKEEGILFKNAAADWLETLRPQIKESSSVKYQNMLNAYILPCFAETALEDISQSMIEAYCSQLLQVGGKEKNGLSPKTVSDILSVIRGILRFSARNGEAVSCNAGAVHIRRPVKETRVLSRDEQNRLSQYIYSHINARNAGILMSLYAGLRIGEICALRWEDIFWREGMVYVHQTMQRLQTSGDGEKKTRIIVTTPKSGCSVRRIPIPDELLRLIATIKHSDMGYFLAGNKQSLVEPRTMENHFKRVLNASGIAPANYHALRHTFATRCVELGFDVKSLSEILGHASVSITMNRYVHPSMELKKENMERLSALLPEASLS